MSSGTPDRRDESPVGGATDDVAELRAEIAETRAALGDTVDELASRLDVTGQLKTKAAQTRRGLVDGAERLHDAAPAPVRSALDQLGRVGRPAAETARPYRRQLAVGAAAALLGLVVLNRRQRS